MTLIRPETRADADAIAAVTAAAFAVAPHASGTEAAIVAALRRSGRLALSLVAEEEGVVGHVAFSPLRIGAEEGWFALGPVSVLPERQGQGIGAALIREGLARLRAAGAAGVALLGDPGYYGRFGFAHDPALTCPGLPAEYLLALPFAESVPAGEVRFDPAFDAT